MTQGLTFTQAAAALGTDVATIARWVRTEQCPVVRDGRKRRIPAAWVDAQPDRVTESARGARRADLA